MNESYHLGPYDKTVFVIFKVLAANQMKLTVDVADNMTLEELTGGSTTMFKLIPGNTATVDIRSVSGGRFEFSVVKHAFIGVPVGQGLDRSVRDGAPNGFSPPDPPMIFCANLECGPMPIPCPPGTVPVCENGELKCKSI